ncbi:Transcriptional repressor NrdR [subsurface metagenome]
MKKYSLNKKERIKKMKCPECGNFKLMVIDSRYKKAINGIRRRRICKSCKSRFTSYEFLDVKLNAILNDMVNTKINQLAKLKKEKRKKAKKRA